MRKHKKVSIASEWFCRWYYAILEGRDRDAEVAMRGLAHACGVLVCSNPSKTDIDTCADLPSEKQLKEWLDSSLRQARIARRLLAGFKD